MLVFQAVSDAVPSRSEQRNDVRAPRMTFCVTAIVSEHRAHPTPSCESDSFSTHHCESLVARGTGQVSGCALATRQP